MFKPTRGPSKPSVRTSGINEFALVKFLEQAKDYLERNEKADQAFVVEMLTDYFKHDYEPGKPLKFTAQVVGM